MERASKQDACSWGDDDVKGSEQGHVHVLSFDSEDDLEFEEEYHDKIYNRPISNLVVACVGLFRRQMSQKSSSFASDKPGTTAESRKELAEFIVHMNDTFSCWMAETADLADNIIHDLDSLFNEYKDRKVMAINVLEVLIEALQYGMSLSLGYLQATFATFGLIMTSKFRRNGTPIHRGWGD